MTTRPATPPQSGTAPSRVSKTTYELMKYVATPIAEAAVLACNALGTFPVCMAALDAWNLGLMMPFMASGYNHYDMRIKCEVPGLCYNFTLEQKWMNREDVQQALGVHKTWQECARPLALAFAGQEMRDVDHLLPPLLEAGVRVLIYAGDDDMICNWIGNKAWTLGMPWPGKDAFNAAEDEAYVVDGKTAGVLRSADGFSFLQVHEAGHMVPRAFFLVLYPLIVAST